MFGMGHVRAYLGALTLALPLLTVDAQQNLGFEANAVGAPTGWSVRGAGYSIVVDGDKAFEGHNSLRISAR